MRKAARAIIIRDNTMLVMRRSKNGTEYYTLVGGRINDDESIEQGLAREVLEETGLIIQSAQLVFTEKHSEPANEQYIYLCNVNNTQATIQDTSEEALMNSVGLNTHTLNWVELSSFSRLHFRTPNLQIAIIEALNNGFPETPIAL